MYLYCTCTYNIIHASYPTPRFQVREEAKKKINNPVLVGRPNSAFVLCLTYVCTYIQPCRGFSKCSGPFSFLFFFLSSYKSTYCPVQSICTYVGMDTIHIYIHNQNIPMYVYMYMYMYIYCMHLECSYNPFKYQKAGLVGN